MAMISDDDWGKWFEAVWATREEEFYPQFFGPNFVKIYNLERDIFIDYFKMDDCDPSWLSNIVVEYSPTETRDSWLYVTSGLSNPVGQEPDQEPTNGFSGLGFEILIETNERAHWPIQVLHRIMAYQLLVATGHLRGTLLEYDLVIPYGESVTSDSQIQNFVVLEPDEGRGYPLVFQLPSGSVEFMLLFGITDQELERMPDNQESDLLARFMDQTIFPLTDASRASVHE